MASNAVRPLFFMQPATKEEKTMERLKRLGAITLAIVLSISMIPATEVSAASKKVKLNKKKVTIYVGKTVKLKVKNTKKKVKWKSSNKKVATVSKKGKVKGKKPGKATITAKVGKKKYKCKVTVKKKVSKNNVTNTGYQNDSNAQNNINNTKKTNYDY